MKRIKQSNNPTIKQFLLFALLATLAATTGWATARSDYNPGHSDFPDLEQEDLVDLTIAAGDDATGAYDADAKTITATVRSKGLTVIVR